MLQIKKKPARNKHKNTIYILILSELKFKILRSNNTDTIALLDKKHTVKVTLKVSDHQR